MSSDKKYQLKMETGFSDNPDHRYIEIWDNLTKEDAVRTITASSALRVTPTGFPFLPTTNTSSGPTDAYPLTAISCANRPGRRRAYIPSAPMPRGRS